VAADDEILTLGDVVRVRARTHADRVALQEWDGARFRDTTYRDLGRQVDALSDFVLANGIVPRDKVAILMPNGRPWIVAYFAVHNIGAVAVPLEYDYLNSQPENISFALGHAEARMVVVSPQDVERARRAAAPSLCRVLPFAGPTRVAAPAQPIERPDVAPDELAQILYTSGTTGCKKGVALSHENVLSNVRACCARFRFRAEDCLPALLPYHHAYPLTATIVLPLYAGGRVPVGDVRDRRLGELLRAAQPTILVGVPRFFDAFLKSIEKAARKAGALERLQRTEALCGRVKGLTGLNLSRLLLRGLHRKVFGGTQLRFCVSGGARLSPELALRYLRLGIPLLQGWGMTELSPVGAVQPFSRFKLLFTRYYERNAGSIGLPVDGAEISLHDVPEQDICVERDGRGEMVVRGPQVMLCYHKDPDTTARMKSDAGLRTGDVAMRDAEGHLRVVGRAKHVIVLPGGKKVFPEEDMEEELSRCASIEEFAVRSITNAEGEEQVGIIIKPRVETVTGRGVKTFGELYALVKGEMDEALRDKPDYVRRLDFCLTELREGRFCDLVKNLMDEPCPLKNEFRFETAYSACHDSDRSLELKVEQA